MRETVEAIYERGVFRPIRELAWISEHGRVRLTVSSLDNNHPLGDVVGILPDEDAQEMSQIIDDEFEGIDPNGWK